VSWSTSKCFVEDLFGVLIEDDWEYLMDQSSSKEDPQVQVDIQAKRRRQIIGLVSYYKRHLTTIEKLLVEKKIVDLKYKD